MLLSIVIPTKNRQEYCFEAVKQILSLELKETQIVVKDNSDTDFLKKKFEIEGIIDLVDYHYSSEILSFVDNFSQAIALAQGEYICLIGDDDGVLSNIEAIARKAKMLHYDAIIPGLNSVYFWPTTAPIIKGAEAGFLNTAYIKSNEYDVQAVSGLYKLMIHAGQNYQNLDLPRIYHGLVSRRTIELAKELSGRYFGGLTPDIYMAVTLSLVSTRVRRLDFPITISGICPTSGSSDSATGKHTGNIESAPHFNGHKSYEWDEKVPKIYTVETIWAETVLQALKDCKQEDLYNKFRVSTLDAICLQKYPQFKKIILSHAKRYGYSRNKLILSQYLYFMNRNIDRVLRRLKRKRNDVNKYYSVPDIKKAHFLTMLEMKEKLKNDFF